MKRIAAIVGIGVCLGIVLLVIQKSLEIDDDTFFGWYLVIAPAVVIGAALVNLLYSMRYLTKARKLVRLLDEGNPIEYVSGLEALLKTAKGRHLRNILTLNLAAGRIETKDLDDAISMLEAIPEQQLRGKATKAARRINLCIAYFETEQYEKAQALIDDSDSLFRKCPYGASVAAVDAMAAIMKEDYDRAENLIETARATYPDRRFQRSFDDLSRILETKRADAKTETR